MLVEYQCKSQFCGIFPCEINIVNGTRFILYFVIFWPHRDTSHACMHKFILKHAGLLFMYKLYQPLQLWLTLNLFL